MTQNQIAYMSARELQRHNKAAEIENERHNKVTEAYDKWKNQLTALQISETQRANIANEDIKRQQNAINAGSVAETQRHNEAVENLNAMATASQNALNSVLGKQAQANAASSYAAAELSREKVSTEKTVQALNTSNSLLSSSQSNINATKLLNYGTEMNYVLSQTDLNKANLRKVRTETGRIEVQTQHEGVNMLWDSISGALNLLKGGSSSFR